MTEHDPKEPEEDFSDLEEMVFEDMDSERKSMPRTARSEAPFFAGQILGGRFEILAEIRETSTSQIVRAKDRVRGGSELSLDVVRRDVLAHVEDLPERIQNVIPRLKELSHDAINPLLDFGMLPDGRLYFASQLLEGRSLAEMLGNNEPFTSEEAFAITRRILRALEYGLSVQQLHGSLEPANVFFEDSSEELESSIRLLSFGYAAVLAPADNPLSSNRDLAVVGPLLAQMLVGRPVQGHLHTWWDDNAPALPKQAAAIVKQALLSARGEGFSGVKEFREAIEALPLLRGEEQTSRLGSLLALALTVGGLGAGAVWAVNQWGKEDVVLASDADEQLPGTRDGSVVAGPPDAAPLDDSLDEEALRTPSVDPIAESASAADQDLARRIDAQIARVRAGLDATNLAVVDLRATALALDVHMQRIDSRLTALEADRATSVSPVAGPLAGPVAGPVAGPLAPAPSELPLPSDSSPALQATAAQLFSGKSSPFGPIGSRTVHHTLTAEGDEGWLVITVGRDPETPAGANQSWILEEEYLSSSGKPLSKRDVHVVQRGSRFEEVDDRVYPLLDLENPWIELSTATFEPRKGLVPPASLGLADDAVESFRQRIEASPVTALIKVDGERSSWFVPGLGFVRYDDPQRIQRELVVQESR